MRVTDPPRLHHPLKRDYLLIGDCLGPISGITDDLHDARQLQHERLLGQPESGEATAWK
jgi:hypothetical protein